MSVLQIVNWINVINRCNLLVNDLLWKSLQNSSKSVTDRRQTRTHIGSSKCKCDFFFEFSFRLVLKTKNETTHKIVMGKRKSTQTQSHDRPKRGRQSASQNNDDTSDEVRKISIFRWFWRRNYFWYDDSQHWKKGKINLFTAHTVFECWKMCCLFLLFVVEKNLGWRSGHFDYQFVRWFR